jgi:hypothetical protein
MTWPDYRWRLAPDSRWVALPLAGPAAGGWQAAAAGWQAAAAGRLLGPGAPPDLGDGLARQLEFWLTDCQRRRVPAALALVPDDLALVAAVAELHTYRLDETDLSAGSIEWLSSNLAAGQPPATGRATAEVVELPAGPAVRLRGIYTEVQDQEGSGTLVERVLHAVRPPQISDLLLLSTTWAVLALGDELALRADALARTLTVEPLS